MRLSSYNMVIGYRVDDTEFRKVIFVGSIVTMPSHDIKRRMILLSHKKLSKELGNNFPFFIVSVFIPSLWRHKVALVCQSIGACKINWLLRSNIATIHSLAFWNLPIGPRSGNSKWAPKTSRTYPRLFDTIKKSTKESCHIWNGDVKHFTLTQDHQAS